MGLSAEFYGILFCIAARDYDLEILNLKFWNILFYLLIREIDYVSKPVNRAWQ